MKEITDRRHRQAAGRSRRAQRGQPRRPGGHRRPGGQRQPGRAVGQPRPRAPTTARRSRRMKKVVAAQNGGLDKDVLTYQQARLKDVKSGAEAPDRRAGLRQRAGRPRRQGQGGRRGARPRSRASRTCRSRCPSPSRPSRSRSTWRRPQQFGVKPGDVRRAAAILLSGIEVGQLFYDQKVFDVVVWGTPETRQDEDGRPQPPHRHAQRAARCASKRWPTCAWSTRPT